MYVAHSVARLKKKKVVGWAARTHVLDLSSSPITDRPYDSVSADDSTSILYPTVAPAGTGNYVAVYSAVSKKSLAF